MKLVVGSTGQILLAHRHVLELSSDFFKVAMKDTWMEGQRHEVNLPEDEPETLSLYLFYLYRGELATTSKTTAGKAYGAELTQLAKLLTFGEKYQDVALKNAVIDAMIVVSSEADKKGGKRFLSDGVVDIIYKGTQAKSRARELIIELHIRYGNDTWLNQKGKNNGNFVLELLTALMKRKSLENVSDFLAYPLTPSHYHEKARAKDAKAGELVEKTKSG